MKRCEGIQPWNVVHGEEPFGGNDALMQGAAQREFGSVVEMRNRLAGCPAFAAAVTV